MYFQGKVDWILAKAKCLISQPKAMPFNKGLALLQFLLTYLVGYAQTPIDQIVIPAKNAGVQVFYERGSFKKYWEGTNLRENGNIGTVIRTSVQPSLFVGITDKLNFYAGMPYIRKVSAEPNGGHLDKTYGFQDLNLALKYEILRKRKAGNELSVLSTLGFSTRLTNYSSDNGFYSLGLGVPEVSARGIIAYTLKSNTYFRADAGYLWRGYTKIYRDSYYYKDRVIYSHWMDVPDAIAFGGTAGLWALGNALRFEINYSGIRSLNGDDIRPYSEPKAANRVNFDKLGAMAQYFFTANKNIGVMGNYNRVINGKNTPQINAYGAGLIFKFKAY